MVKVESIKWRLNDRKALLPINLDDGFIEDEEERLEVLFILYFQILFAVY